jgi:hypothetical protein
MVRKMEMAKGDRERGRDSRGTGDGKINECTENEC